MPPGWRPVNPQQCIGQNLGQTEQPARADASVSEGAPNQGETSLATYTPQMLRDAKVVMPDVSQAVRNTLANFIEHRDSSNPETRLAAYDSLFNLLWADDSNLSSRESEFIGAFNRQSFTKVYNAVLDNMARQYEAQLVTLKNYSLDQVFTLVGDEPTPDQCRMAHAAAYLSLIQDRRERLRSEGHITHAPVSGDARALYSRIRDYLAPDGNKPC
jgi:hypothetical protein